jgi:hypothetical protein
MGKIETQIKDAFNQFRKDGNFHAFLRKLLCDADYSVRFAWQFSETLDALKRQCPRPVFECMFYDDEHGHYHLFDFNPNNINRESILIEVRARLQSECYIDPDGIDKAMESVYLIDTNMIRKVVE